MGLGRSTPDVIELFYELDGVSVSYNGSNAISDVSFRLLAGEHTAILGPSGSGKSTLLRVLAGIDPPSKGRVLLNGRVASSPQKVHIPPHKRELAMVFQDLALWPNLTAEENVRLAALGGGLKRRVAKSRVDEALQFCGVSHLAKRKPSRLSGGEQQRLALARAIVCQPAFLVLDEPFAGIDILTKVALLNEIARLARERQLTILLVSHDPWEAIHLCRNTLVLEQGRLVQDGPIDAVLENPVTDFGRAMRDLLSATAAD